MAETTVSQLEVRRQAIQDKFDETQSALERNRLGQFATPAALAHDIADHLATFLADPTFRIRFADPAIGSGSFYSAALSAFGPERIDSAIGVELDPTLCKVARELWGTLGLEVVCADFTRFCGGSRPPSPNLMMANPPYVRHHHLKSEDKERLQLLTQSQTGIKVSGLAGLYVHFLLLATAWLQDDGYAAWLIPSEFMDVNYGDCLRQFLTERVTLIGVHRFDPSDGQFTDALVSSAVLEFRKATPPSDHVVRFSFGGTLKSPRVGEEVELRRLRESRKWSIYPRHSTNDRRLSSDQEGPTLARFFRVQRGIATGCNKFFVLDREDALRRGLPNRYLKPILPSPRTLKTTIIEEGDDGYPLLDQQLCVLDCDLPEPLVEQRHPSLWAYLQSANALGIRDGYIVGKRTPWYKQEQREVPPFLCTYMGRGTAEKLPFRFILNRSKAIGTNLYLHLYPQNRLAFMLRKHPTRFNEVHKLLAEVTGDELRGEGRVYGGGLHKIEPRELSRISAVSFIERWPELQAHTNRVKIASLF